MFQAARSIVSTCIVDVLVHSYCVSCLSLGPEAGHTLLMIRLMRCCGCALDILSTPSATIVQTRLIYYCSILCWSCIYQLNRDFPDVSIVQAGRGLQSAGRPCSCRENGSVTDINVKKNCQFKTWCKGDKSNIENSTDHFCEDTRQNALVALTNLGYVTPFYCLDPLIIWRYNGWEKSLHWTANYQIRPKFT